LYIRALLRGLDPAPPADLAFRHELATVAAREGRGALHARLAATAPTVARRLHPNDQVRVMRALERLRDPASPLDEARWREAGDDYDVVYVGLTMARADLVPRLEARAAAMARAGLAEEVEALLRRGYDPALSALQGIGYREFVRVVRGELDAATAVRLMQRETVRYAKRQGTWFAREPGIEWLDVTVESDAAHMAGLIHRKLEGARRRI
jgi:tRNA dimethylallyltransferase